MKRYLLSLCLVAYSCVLMAAAPKWKAQFPKDINWMKLTPSGILVVATEDALYGLDPASGNIKWSHDFLKKVKKEEFEEIAQTPYVVMKRKEALGWPFNAIIDAQSGKIILNTREIDNCMGITARLYLRDYNAFFFYGIDKKGKNMMGVFDINESKLKWFLPSPFATTEMILINPTYLDDNSFLITTYKGIYQFDYNTGNSKLFVEQKLRVQAKLYFKRDLEKLYLLSQDEICAYSTKDGSHSWSAPVPLDAPATYVIEGEKGWYVNMSEKIQGFNYQTGETMFGKKSVSLEAPVVAHVPTEKGIALYLRKDKYSGIYLMNPNTGLPVNKKEIDFVSTIEDIRLTSVGLLYRTGLRMNIADLETGKGVWKKPIDFKSSPVSADYQNKIVLFDSKFMYKVDLQSGTFDQAPYNNQFEGDETPSTVEVRGDKFLLKSAQNLTLLDDKGNVIYHVYRKTPGQGAFAVIAAATMAAAYTAGTVNNNLNNMAAAQADANRTGNAQTYSTYKIDNAPFTAMMNRRFSATKEAMNFVTMLTKIDEDGEKGIGLVKIDKRTGKKVSQVVINEKEPVYEIDEADDMLYWMSEKREVSGFVF